MEIFAERLKDLRTEKGLSQRELSTLLGLSNSVINKWESGVREPTAEAVVSVAEFFGVSTDYLLGLTD